MTADSKVVRVRKEIMPAIEEYWGTRSKKNPHGCPEKLKRVVKIWDECKQGLNGSMPTANKIGYADRRDDLNASMEHYGLRHSYS